MLKKFKDLYKVQKQAKQIKKQLKNIHIEAEAEGILITISAEQKLIDIKLPEVIHDTNKLKQNLIKAFNKAMEKSQQISAEKMKGVMGDMGLDLPGMKQA